MPENSERRNVNSLTTSATEQIFLIRFIFKRSIGIPESFRRSCIPRIPPAKRAGVPWVFVKRVVVGSSIPRNATGKTINSQKLWWRSCTVLLRCYDAVFAVTQVLSGQTGSGTESCRHDNGNVQIFEPFNSSSVIILQICLWTKTNRHQRWPKVLLNSYHLHFADLDHETSEQHYS